MNSAAVSEDIRAEVARRGVAAVASDLARALREDRPCLGLSPSDLAPHEIGRLYEALLSLEARRRNRLGAFYTPPEVAAALTERALATVEAACESGRPLRILDPACGTGAFLVAAAERLEARGWPKPAVSAALSGLDRDPVALSLCRALLSRQGYDLPRENLSCRDALQDPWPLAHYDLVLGNPPFLNIVRLPPEDRRRLKARYRTFRNKCDLYGLFLEAGLSHLRSGGVLCFILSDSFLGTQSFAPLRRLVFASPALRVREILRLESSTFRAGVHPLALLVEARPREEGTSVAFGRMNRLGRCTQTFELPASVLARRAERSAALPTAPEELAWAESFEAGQARLDEFLALSLGVKTGDDGRFVAPLPRAEGRWLPCLRGRNVRRFRIEAGGFLDYRPAVLRAVHGARPRREADLRRPSKILLRETSGRRLVAAVDTEGRIPLDTLHALWPRPDRRPGRSLWAWAALLNSGPVGRWYGLHHPGPHVKAGEVRALPVPPPRAEDPQARMEATAALAAYLAGGPWAAEVERAPETALDLLGRWRSRRADPRADAAIDRITETLYAR